MNKCVSCGSYVDDDEMQIVYEKHPYGAAYAVEEFFVCPHCGGDCEEYKGEDE